MVTRRGIESQALTRGFRALLSCAAAVCAFAAFAPSSAQAYTQTYCGLTLLNPGWECASSGLHSWYYNSATGAGGYSVCEYMWNAHNGVIRGSSITCRPNFTDRTWNRTSDQWYNARVINNAPIVLNIQGHAIA